MPVSLLHLLSNRPELAFHASKFITFLAHLTRRVMPAIGITLLSLSVCSRNYHLTSWSINQIFTFSRAFNWSSWLKFESRQLFKAASLLIARHAQLDAFPAGVLQVPQGPQKLWGKWSHILHSGTLLGPSFSFFRKNDIDPCLLSVLLPNVIWNEMISSVTIQYHW